jgi:hypothetical protein
MRFTWTLKEIRAAIALMVLAFGASICRADDCGATPYAYENRVILFACDKSGAPELRVIVLDDAGPWEVTGRVPSAAKRSFDAAAHLKNFVMLLTSNIVGVYDFEDANHPTLVASLARKEREKLPGYPRIDKIAADKFLVLVVFAMGAAELTAQGDAPKWSLGDVQVTPDMQKQSMELPAEFRFTPTTGAALPVRETAQFRYDLVWKTRTKPGEAIDRQLLRKTDKKTQQTVSELVLGTRLETID